jgi:hypothetical protein
VTVDRLELELLALAAHIEFPQTPDFVVPVADRRLRAVGRPRYRAKRLAVAVAMLLALAAGAYATSSSLRDTVRDWLGSSAVQVDRVETLPSLSPASASTRPGLGRADSALGRQLLLPKGLGRPTGVRVVGRGQDAAVTLTWTPRTELPAVRRTGIGLVINQVLGSIEEPFVRKVVGPGTEVTTFRIDGRSAVGLVGAPHNVAFRDSDGDPTFQRTRLAVNTLLVAHGEVLVRIEADVPLAHLIAIDRSLR